MNIEQLEGAMNDVDEMIDRLIDNARYRRDGLPPKAFTGIVTATDYLLAVRRVLKRALDDVNG